tara:strand:+ start:290 stop:3289 length:3000 start_codon:yes stop_codon:yes gene_type:complete
MADYYWKGGSGSNGWNTAANWVNSGGSAYGSPPTASDTVIFDNTGGTDCVLDNTNLVANYIYIDSNFGHSITMSGLSAKVVMNGMQISKAAVFSFTASTEFEIRSSGAGWTSYVNGTTHTSYNHYIRYLIDSSPFANATSRLATTYDFNGKNYCLVDGVYPTIDRPGNLEAKAIFKDNSGGTFNSYGSVDLHNFTNNEFTSTSTNPDVYDYDKQFYFEGRYGSPHCFSYKIGENFKFGHTTVIFRAGTDSQGAHFQVPVKGDIISSVSTRGNITTNVFNVQYHKVIIRAPPEAAQLRYCYIEDGRTLECNELVIESGGRLYGPAEGEQVASAKIKSVKRPTIQGDWNFKQIADGIYESIDNIPTLPVTEGGTGLNTVPVNSLLIGQGQLALTTLAMGSANQVLKVNSGGTALEFATDGAVSAVTNGDDNRVATFSSSTALNGETNLTFDGSTLALTGDFNIGSGDLFVDDSTGRVGIGETTPTSPLHITSSITNPATDVNESFSVFINQDLSGSSATGGNREQGGIYIDVDSSTTGGDTTNEHRAYGIWADVRLNSAADSDLLYGMYGYVEGQRSTGSTTGTTTAARAGYFVAASDETTDYTISELTGVMGYATIQDSGVVTHSYGVRGYNNVNQNRTENVGTLQGGHFEIEISSGRTNGDDITLGDSEVVHAIFDHNPPASGQGKATIGNAYLFRGDYAIVDSAQVTNPWGIYLTGETKNYMSGILSLGTATSGTARLNINSTDTDSEAIRVNITDSDGTADSTPFIVDGDGRVGIGTASPVSGMALTLNGDGTSYEGIAWQVGGSTKFKMSTDSSAFYFDSQVNTYNINFRTRDGSGALRPTLGMEGDGFRTAIGYNGTSGSNLSPQNTLQVNVGTENGVQDKDDGILLLNSDLSIADGDMIGGIGFATRDGNIPSRVTEAAAAIVAYAAEDHSTSDKGGDLVFLTSAIDDDDDTTSTERMRITSEGGIIIANLPTSDPSNAGQLWSNSGVVTVSSG